MTTLDDLARVARELEELDRRRALLVIERDAMLCELHQTTGAPTLSRVVALTTQAIYKIVHRGSNRAVTAKKGDPAHGRSGGARRAP